MPLRTVVYIQGVHTRVVYLSGWCIPGMVYLSGWCIPRSVHREATYPGVYIGCYIPGYMPPFLPYPGICTPPCPPWYTPLYTPWVHPPSRYTLLPWCTPRTVVRDDALGSNLRYSLGNEAQRASLAPECDESYEMMRRVVPLSR